MKNTIQGMEEFNPDNGHIMLYEYKRFNGWCKNKRYQ